MLSGRTGLVTSLPVLCFPRHAPCPTWASRPQVGLKNEAQPLDQIQWIAADLPEPLIVSRPGRTMTQ